MKAKQIGSFQDGSLEWHRVREAGIGGSDAATILGLQPYGTTRHDLWREKLGRAETFQGNVHTDYGTKLEPYLFDEIQDRMTMTTKAVDGGEYEVGSIEVQEFEETLQHPELEWMLGNVDGIVPGEGIVEIKTSTQSPPEHGAKDIHYAQMQHYLGVTGLDYALYCFFESPADKQFTLEACNKFVYDERNEDKFWGWVVSKGELTIRKIARDQPFIERLIDAEMDFWESVQAEEPPGEYLPEGEIEVDDPELADLLDQYGKAKARIDRKKADLDIQAETKRKEAAKEQIKQHCNAYDAKKIHLPNGDKVTWWGSYWRAQPEERNIEDEIDAPF